MYLKKIKQVMEVIEVNVDTELHELLLFCNKNNISYDINKDWKYGVKYPMFFKIKQELLTSEFRLFELIDYHPIYNCFGYNFIER